MRHAQTEYNKKGIIQGSEVDSDINKHGDIQASLFYNYYKSVPFDMVYVSNLKRTYQTVKRFIEAGVPHKKLPTASIITKNFELVENKVKEKNS